MMFYLEFLKVVDDAVQCGVAAGHHRHVIHRLSEPRQNCQDTPDSRDIF